MNGYIKCSIYLLWAMQQLKRQKGSPMGSGIGANKTTVILM